jgi:UDP-2,3-diacylglucosamine pyrophosphatase LpxH
VIREVDLVIISDTHLGTFGCHAAELLSYLNTIEPKILVLNGDIIDIWQFSKRYWPATHSAVLKKIMDFIHKGTRVYYLTGNHDDALRKFSEFEIGNFKLCDKLVLDLDGKKAWIFHGDVFDVSINHAKWLARLGSIGYDILILLNRAVNFVLEKMGREKYSLSKKIKDGVKKAVQFISSFEQVAADLAIMKGYDYVICGHIHQPQIKTLMNKNGSVTYLNSGDWIENLTALEYSDGEWQLYRHPINAKVDKSIHKEIIKEKTFTVFTEEITLTFFRQAANS